jgi:hypothetical protein
MSSAPRLISVAFLETPDGLFSESCIWLSVSVDLAELLQENTALLKNNKSKFMIMFFIVSSVV